MAGRNESNPATHFGRQMRKERLARGWSLDELSARAGVNAAHLSRIENGRRPPTAKLAEACDTVFPERRRWFSEYYEELRHWSEVPAGFRSWGELEDKAASLRVWSPGVVDGLLQTEDYARTLLMTYPAVSDEVVSSRLAARMERQRRLLGRDRPPAMWFLVDQVALLRCVGSEQIMAAQMRRLAETAALPNVTLQVMPAIAHPANASGFIVAGDSAWCEHVAGGYAFTDSETVTALSLRFDTLRGECFRVSESAALLRRSGEIWARGANPATAMLTAASA
jgi:transcriptional regulator with XRE-family HTH domain